MAQARSFNQDDEGNKQARSDTALAPARGVGARPASFVGGDIDQVTGNVMPGSAQQASRGFTVTGTENPAPVVPQPSRIEQIQPDPAPVAAAPAPAPTPAPEPAPFIRKDKSNVVQQVGKWFCYGKDTPILMDDGTWKPVQNIAMGDRVKLGGEVVAVGAAKGSFTFLYKGQRVSGYHAVFEDGRFIRVRDSKYRSGEDDYQGAIYPVMTESHLLVTPTHISADFSECQGGYEMTPEQRLRKMNEPTGFLRWLSDQEALLCHEVA